MVGDSGKGAFNQSGGSTVTVGPAGLAIGRGFGDGIATTSGTGTYSLADTSILNVTGGITLGSYAGNKGTFIQSGGAVNADNEYVGLVGVGDWNQSGGANTATQLSIGNNAGGTGTYELSGSAILNSGAEYVGAAGNGTLTQSGGTNNAASLAIANNAYGVGLYTLTAGTLNNTGATHLGGDIGAQGSFTQTGGTANLGGNVLVGYAASGSLSKLTLGGAGSMTLGGNLDIGVQTGAWGAFDYNTKAGDSATLSFLTAGSAVTVGDLGNGTFSQGGGDVTSAPSASRSTSAGTRAAPATTTSTEPVRSRPRTASRSATAATASSTSATRPQRPSTATSRSAARARAPVRSTASAERCWSQAGSRSATPARASST